MRRDLSALTFAILVTAANLTAVTVAYSQQSAWEQAGEDGPMVATFGFAFDEARGVAVLHGGRSDGGLSEYTFEWDGAQWLPVSALAGEIVGQAMAYDAVRGLCVRFGGSGYEGLVAPSTWGWDGVNWIELASEGPPPRYGSAMVYDSRREVIVLFGGVGDAETFGDTWEWDGISWTQVANSGPTPRVSFGMSYDARQGLTILHGGSRDSFTLRDTWAWDGVVWRQISTAGPYRHSFAQAYDSSRNVTVLYSGQLGGQFYDDTWEWDGSTWKRTLDDGPPWLRRHHAMCYDTRRGAILMHGGEHNSAYYPDTWYYGCTPPIVLIVGASCPSGGAISIEWSGAAPDAAIALLYGRDLGSTVIPTGRPCEGTFLGLLGGVFRINMLRSGPEGSGRVAGEAGAGACGGHLQLLEPSTCATSNASRIE